MTAPRDDIRLALPSKGRLAEGALSFLAEAGLQVYKPNPRQYQATIPALPGLTVLFQRAGDIAVSVRDGSVDFGITGWDTVCERGGQNGEILPLHQELGFGQCSLNVIVPESWGEVRTMADLARERARLGRPLRVATKYPNLTGAFFRQHGLDDTRLIQAEGTLEVAPAIGYADLIVDLVSSGTTLRDNRLRGLQDGQILSSQACLIGNLGGLESRPPVLQMALTLLEFIVAHLRAKANVAVFANIRGSSPGEIAQRMFTQSVLGGLQGPTISPVITRRDGDWHAVHIIVRRDQLTAAIAELRAIGGSGVVVAPVVYIFEEQPAACQALLKRLKE
jgi:ATP phosphoribosyltransferase